MSTYWIGDAIGRVLGPMTLASLRELIGSGKLKAVSRASRDGVNWVPIQAFPEVKDLLNAASPSGGAFEKSQADRLRLQLKNLETMPAYDVFGVKAHASLDEVRNAFFRIVKRYSPERLGPEVHVELRRASEEMFEFLTRRMREYEAQVASAPRAGPPAPPTPGRVLPTYGAHEFVGLQKRENDRMHADVKVNAKTAGMFTDHTMVNLSSGALFIPSDRPLRLGTEIDLTLHFDNPSRRIDVRGSVIWEHAFNDGKQPQGYGVRLGSLNASERAFLKDYVTRVRGG